MIPFVNQGVLTFIRGKQVNKTGKLSVGLEYL